MGWGKLNDRISVDQIMDHPAQPCQNIGTKIQFTYMTPLSCPNGYCIAALHQGRIIYYIKSPTFIPGPQPGNAPFGFEGFHSLEKYTLPKMLKKLTLGITTITPFMKTKPHRTNTSIHRVATLLLSVGTFVLPMVPMQADETEDIRALRKARAEASYLEMKGDRQGAIEAYERSLQIQHDEAIAQRTQQLKSDQQKASDTTGGDVFAVIQPGSRMATLKVIDYSQARRLLDPKTSSTIIEAFVNSGEVTEPEKGALEAYLAVLAPSMGGIEAFTNITTLGGAFAGGFGSVFGEFGARLSTEISKFAGYANLLIAAGQTYSDITTKGWQAKETGAGVYKNLAGNFSTLASLWRGPYVESARAFSLNLGFAAVFVFGFTIDQVVNEAQGIRDATIRDVHSAYFSASSSAYRSDEDWFNLFVDYYNRTMQNPNDPSSAFAQAYQSMRNDVESYIVGYWEHGANDIFTILEAGRKFNYNASETERALLDSIARKNLYARLNKNVLPKVQRFMQSRFNEEAASAMDKLCEPVNRIMRLSIFESQPDEFEERHFAGYNLRFGTTRSDGDLLLIDQPEWQFTLPTLEEEPTPLDISMTVLGYLQAGAPNTLLLFEPGKQPDLEAAIKVPFQMNDLFVDVDLANTNRKKKNGLIGFTGNSNGSPRGGSQLKDTVSNAFGFCGNVRLQKSGPGRYRLTIPAHAAESVEEMKGSDGTVDVRFEHFNKSSDLVFEGPFDPEKGDGTLNYEAGTLKAGFTRTFFGPRGEQEVYVSSDEWQILEGYLVVKKDSPWENTSEVYVEFRFRFRRLVNGKNLEPEENSLHFRLPGIYD